MMESPDTAGLPRNDRTPVQTQSLARGTAIPSDEKPLQSLARTSFAASPFLALGRASKLAQTSFQFPRVAAFEYWVARVSKKLACSTPLISGAGLGSAGQPCRSNGSPLITPPSRASAGRPHATRPAKSRRTAPAHWATPARPLR